MKTRLKFPGYCLLLCLAAAGASASAAAAEAQPRIKIAVLDIRADTNLEKGMLKTLNELVLTEVQETGKFEAFGSSDIASMLTLEEQRVQVTGCADDSCLAEIGGAMGVDQLLSVSIGAVGAKYLVNMKVINVSEAKVFKRANAIIDQDDTTLIKAIQETVKKIVRALAGEEPDDAGGKAEGSGQGETAAGAGGQAGGGAATAAVPDGTLTGEPGPAEGPSKVMDILPWVGVGLTVAALGTGAVLGGLAMSDKKAIADEYHGTSAWQDLRDSRESKALGADVLFGVAGAAAVATLVLFLLPRTPTEGEAAPEASATVVPLAGGGALAAIQLRTR